MYDYRQGRSRVQIAVYIVYRYSVYAETHGPRQKVFVSFLVFRFVLVSSSILSEKSVYIDNHRSSHRHQVLCIRCLFRIRNQGQCLVFLARAELCSHQPVRPQNRYPVQKL